MNSSQSSDAPLEEKIAIVGLGLIGGSFAAALKQNGFAGHISALVRTEAAARKAMAIGYVDHASTDAQSVVSSADLVLLAVPMLAMREQLERVKPFLMPSCVVTDAGSVKGPFVEDARLVLTDIARVVPGHPIAGREKSGIDSVDAALYQGKRVLLTPLDETLPEAVEQVTRLWQQCGAMVESLAVDHHDRVLASTSHLPHALAFALVDTLTSGQRHEEIFRYAAGGFGDFTRIASGDAVMWRDIFLTNKTAVCDALDAFNLHLAELRDAIESEDGDKLETVFRRAKQSRDEHFEQTKQPTKQQ
ncbi:MAG: prephenate dehydrogenase/arogenate dehydrogenase family protein [Granulosicoccaceae bacterium]